VHAAWCAAKSDCNHDTCLDDVAPASESSQPESEQSELSATMCQVPMLKE
jgi:hypothetical protein